MVADFLVGVPVADELHFVADLVWPVALGAFVIVSLGLIASSARRRPAASTAGVLPGLVPALVAGVLISVPIVLLTAFFASYYSPDDLPQQVLSAFLLSAGPVALSVLDVYAIWPPLRRTVGGAIARASIGVVLSVAVLGVISHAFSIVNSAAADEGIVAERLAVEARSAGLSIHVEVVNAELGETNANGRLVSHLTLDITLRSTTQIQNSPLTDEDFIGESVWIKRADSFGLQVTKDFFGLPADIPAGFDETYRVDEALSKMELAEYYTTGPWEANLNLMGPLDEEGFPIFYEVRTVFTVPEAP